MGDIACVTCSNASSHPIMVAPPIIRKITLVSRIVLDNAINILRIVSCLVQAKPIIRTYRLATAPDSVGVMKPNKIPPIMIPGAIKAGVAPAAAVISLVNENSVLTTGKLSLVALILCITIKAIPRNNPGIIPAINNPPTSVAVIAPKRIINMLGGIIGPISELPATNPAAYESG